MFGYRKPGNKQRVSNNNYPVDGFLDLVRGQNCRRLNRDSVLRV